MIDQCFSTEALVPPRLFFSDTSGALGTVMVMGNAVC